MNKPTKGTETLSHGGNMMCLVWVLVWFPCDLKADVDHLQQIYTLACTLHYVCTIITEYLWALSNPLALLVAISPPTSCRSVIFMPVDKFNNSDHYCWFFHASTPSLQSLPHVSSRWCCWQSVIQWISFCSEISWLFATQCRALL